jgi:hypothetical protein
VPAASALLAMFAVSLARYLSSDSVWTMVLVNNRFRPGLADSVSQLVQSSPFQLELAGASLATAVARAQQGLLGTYKNAYYDSYRQDEVVERVERERGVPVRLCCYYTDRQDGLPSAAPAGDQRLRDDQLRAAQAQGGWQDEPDGPLPAVPLFLNVDHLPDALEFPVSFDTRYLDRAAVLSIVRGIERAAVQTVLEPDALAVGSDRPDAPAVGSDRPDAPAVGSDHRAGAVGAGDPDDPVVLGGGLAVPVPVAGGQPQRAVRAGQHGPQPPVDAGE